MKPSDLRRFRSKFVPGDYEECWLWLGAPDVDGYGEFRMEGENYRAHRLAWEVANGPIPDGLLIMHDCDNPPCVNPSHLRPGTNAENLADMRAKGRGPTGDRSGARKHPESLARGERHPFAKLREADVREIRRRAHQGEGKASIARAFGVTDVLVGGIVRRKVWAHVTEDAQ